MNQKLYNLVLSGPQVQMLWAGIHELAAKHAIPLLEHIKKQIDEQDAAYNDAAREIAKGDMPRPSDHHIEAAAQGDPELAAEADRMVDQLLRKSKKNRSNPHA